MTIYQWLRDANQELVQAGIQTARLDALILLEDVLGKDRAWILAHDDLLLSDANIAQLEKLLSRRQNHEPLAYIRGFSEFYGRRFKVDANVLEPRPESETMIDLLKELVLSHKIAVQGDYELCIGDIGTGSGALGITASLELSEAQIELIDIDSKALAVAKTNVDLLTSNILLTQSDLLANMQQQNHVLLCNLPYVPDDYQINTAATHEPALALFGGKDGLDLYRTLFKQTEHLPHRPLYILTEALPEQHTALRAIAEASTYKLAKTDDFIQVFAANR